MSFNFWHFRISLDPRFHVWKQFLTQCGVCEGLMRSHLLLNCIPWFFSSSFKFVPHIPTTDFFPIFLKLWQNIRNMSFAIFRIKFSVIGCIHNTGQSPLPSISKTSKNINQDISHYAWYSPIYSYYNLISLIWPIMVSCQAPTCLMAWILLFFQPAPPSLASICDSPICNPDTFQPWHLLSLSPATLFHQLYTQ